MEITGLIVMILWATLSLLVMIQYAPFCKDLSNNDIFYNECVLVVVLFAKRFKRVVSIIKRYAKWFQDNFITI